MSLSSKSSLFVTEKECYLLNIPTVIFALLASYLDYEYQYLMRSSSVFKDIKFETYEQTFTIRDFQLDSDENANFAKLERVFCKFDRVRRKYCSRGLQHLLNLKLLSPTEICLKRFASYFANIYDIGISFSGNVSSDFDFSIFNNINSVYLTDFRGVILISKGFQNIQHLYINSFPDLQSIDCPLIDVDELKLYSCPLLRTINLVKIKSIVLSSCGSYVPDFSKTHDSLQRIDYSPVYNLQLNRLPCQSLQYLHLTIFRLVPDDVNDLNCLANISDVYLHQFFKNNNNAKKFPLFYGRKLSLGGYSLALWTTSLDNLVELELWDCTACKRLPNFPNLRKLLLNGIQGIKEIRTESLPKCSELQISGCSSLRILYLLPKLRYLEIKNCKSFKQFIGYAEYLGDCGRIPFRKFLLDELSSFQNVKSLRNIVHLEILSCGKLKFKKFDQTDLPRSRRYVLLDNNDFKDCDLSGLGNIGRLCLKRIQNLEHGRGIHDIDHLILQWGTELQSFKNLHNLQSVLIHHDIDLLSLDGLQSVPTVSLLFCKVFDLMENIMKKSETSNEEDNQEPSTNNNQKSSNPIDFWQLTWSRNSPAKNLQPFGLQGCGQVYCRADFLIAREAFKYIDDRSSTSFAEIFDTIKDFYVVSVDDLFATVTSKLKLW